MKIINVNQKEAEMKALYEHAYYFLKRNLPDGVPETDLNRYLVVDARSFRTIQDVFERFIESAQNYQRMPNVIKFRERKTVVKKILYNYDLDEIVEKCDIETLYHKFRTEFKVTSADTKRNSWYKWSSSIIDSAKFLREFKRVEDFEKFVDLFSFNVHTRIALPLLISKRIRGIGFALACDALKELGFVEYPKPDVHILDIFSSLNLCKRDEIAAVECVVRMSEICRAKDSSVTPYKIDKILWLICSGNFYNHNIKAKSLKKSFIESTKKLLKL